MTVYLHMSEDIYLSNWWGGGGVVVNATFNSISVISLRSVFLVGSHMEQPCAIHELITEVDKAFPNSTLLTRRIFLRSLPYRLGFFF